MTAALALDEVERLQARLQAMEQERKHLLAVIEILQEIGGTLQFGDIVQSVARRLGETFGLDRCSIFLAERGGNVRLVASYEDPGIRNYVVDLGRYPELQRAFTTGETVFIADAATDASLSPARGALAARRVKSITAIPISWRGSPLGAILLRTFREGPAFSAADLQFCQVVANLTAKALRNAHRFERLQRRRGETDDLHRREREQAALIGFLRQLLTVYPPALVAEEHGDLAVAGSPELERLVGVAPAVEHLGPRGRGGAGPSARLPRRLHRVPDILPVAVSHLAELPAVRIEHRQAVARIRPDLRPADVELGGAVDRRKGTGGPLPPCTPAPPRLRALAAPRLCACAPLRPLHIFPQPLPPALPAEPALPIAAEPARRIEHIGAV